jgi:hypothetical protein
VFAEAQLNPLERLGAGAVAGIIAMSATYPLDMVRGRLTVQEAGQEQYRGIHHAATTIIRREGLMALYKGWVPSVIGVIPYVGLNFAVYESLKAELVARNGYETEQDLHILARVRCPLRRRHSSAQGAAAAVLYVSRRAGHICVCASGCVFSAPRNGGYTNAPTQMHTR